MTRHFYESQNRLHERCQGGQAMTIRGATRVRPFFNPELVGLEAKTNAERRAEYERKLNHIEEAA